jgi:hypothetical protein
MDFLVQYYGLILSITAGLIIANIGFFTVMHGEEAFWARVKLAACRVAGGFGGLGIGAACGTYGLARLAHLIVRAAH